MTNFKELLACDSSRYTEHLRTMESVETLRSCEYATQVQGQYRSVIQTFSNLRHLSPAILHIVSTSAGANRTGCTGLCVQLLCTASLAGATAQKIRSPAIDLRVTTSQPKHTILICTYNNESGHTTSNTFRHSCSTALPRWDLGNMESHTWYSVSIRRLSAIHLTAPRKKATTAAA